MPRQPAANVLTALGFSRSLARLHQRLVGQSGRPIGEVAAALLMTPEELRKELAPLIEGGVVRVEKGRVYADAAVDVVARRLAETAAEASRAAGRLQGIAAAVPLLAGAGGPTASEVDDVLPLDGEVTAGGDLPAVIVDLVATTPGDLLWLRPDQFRMPREQAMIELVAGAIAEGRRSRAIYPVRALVEDRDLLALRMEAGEEIRVLPELPTRMVVIGAGHALLPEPLGFSDDPRSIIHQRGVVEALAMWFEEMWDRAEAVHELGADAHPEMRRLLLEQLASGAQDAQIARRLGLSLRTVRRRVAELLAELGAESRFQAGVEAVRRGWL